jgi:hypothetical protein
VAANHTIEGEEMGSRMIIERIIRVFAQEGMNTREELDVSGVLRRTYLVRLLNILLNMTVVGANHYIGEA